MEEMAENITVSTAPADSRFPTTNQAKHCFTRYNGARADGDPSPPPPGAPSALCALCTPNPKMGCLLAATPSEGGSSESGGQWGSLPCLSLVSCLPSCTA